MIKRVLQPLLPQPMLAIFLGSLAVLSITIVFRGISTETVWWLDIPTLAIALGLMIASVIADQRPVHVTYHTKMAFTTVPLFLMAVLLPAPLTILAAAISTLTGEMLERRRRGSLVPDIIGATARAIIVGLVGAGVSRITLPFEEARLIVFFLVAGAMFVADILVSSLEIAAIMGEPPRRIIAMVVREIVHVEAVQYVLGILGAAAALIHPGLLFLLPVPVFFVYRAFRSARVLQTGTRQLLESLADTVDLRDPYTGGHSRRVTFYCEKILSELGLEGPDAELILTAARVHDIGKIGIPDGVLNKPGLLDPEERAIMETHSARGRGFVAALSRLRAGRRHCAPSSRTLGWARIPRPQSRIRYSLWSALARGRG